MKRLSVMVIIVIAFCSALGCEKKEPPPNVLFIAIDDLRLELGCYGNPIAQSLHDSGEFNQYKLTDGNASLSKAVSDDYAKKIKHAYLAGVSYIDTQVGKVLNELRSLGLDKNTIVVVWGTTVGIWVINGFWENTLFSTMPLKVP